MIIKRLRKTLNEISKIWQKYDQLESWIGVIWLVKKQIEEIEEGKYRGDVVLKEVADILIILVRYLDKIGIDPEKLMLHRLNTRHKGRTQEILEKYDKMFKEETQPYNAPAIQCSYRCPKCRKRCEGVEGHKGLHQDENHHFWLGERQAPVLDEYARALARSSGVLPNGREKNE